MQRLLVVLLAAFDAVIVVATGVAVALAALTLLWVFGIGGAPWDALWPAAGTVWQLGHLVPLSIVLPGEYLAATGIDPDAASFTLSLAPLAFSGFTAIFAARSGARAARSGAWLTGVGSGTIVVGALSSAIALSCRNPIASVHLWQAALFSTLVFAVPALAGALATAWREGDGGLIDRLHDRVDAWPGLWPAAPGLIVRGAAIATTGFVGVGALAVAVALVLRGGEVIALFESGSVDLIGATVLTLGQLAYLPTLAVWGASFVAGPGFAVGVGTAVSPASTQLGVVPAVPLLGAVPEGGSPWLLTVALVPVVIGGLAGWSARSRISAADIPPVPDAAAAVPVHPALAGLIPQRPADPVVVDAEPAPRPVAVPAVIALGIAVGTAGAAALLAFLASGSFGPGRLAETGPAPGPVALAVGVETLLGAAIAIFTPRRMPRPSPRPEPEPETTELVGEAPVAASADLLDELRARVADARPRERSDAGSDAVTAPIELPDPSTLGRGRPAPLPPPE